MIKILHVSHNSLPDWRVEKSALTGRKFGYEPYFAGPNSTSYDRKDTFARVFALPWESNGTLKWWARGSAVGNQLYWFVMKKQIKRVVNELRPDIIHAHNLYSAKIVSSLKMPFVYDDHEFWSQRPRINRDNPRSSSARRVIDRYISWLWSEWERKIISVAPVITTSEAVAEHHRNVGQSNRVFFVPNYPTEHEIMEIEQPIKHSELSSVYLGADNEKRPVPHRNVAGLSSLFRANNIGRLVWIGIEGKSDDAVTYRGFLPRRVFYKEMSNHSIGLLPWQKHWSHSFFNPNKPYEYAHAGLLVISNSVFREVLRGLKDNCMTFCDYHDLAATLLYLKNNLEELYQKRVRTFEFARENLLWERNEMHIIQAYRSC